MADFDERWQLNDITPEARDAAEAAAAVEGVSPGIWLDALIRERTGIGNARLSAVSEDTGLREIEVSGTGNEPDGDTDTQALFFATGPVPADDDLKVADAAIGSNLKRLLDDSDENSAAVSNHAHRPATPTSLSKSASSHRSMFVGAGIVVVSIAIAAIIYQWANTAVAPPAANNPARPSAAPQEDTTAPDTVPENPSAAAIPSSRGAVVPDPAGAPSRTTDDTTRDEVDPTHDEADDASFIVPPPPDVPAENIVATLHAAASTGDARAQYDLAIHYIRGQDLRRDYSAAAYWLRRAATGGLARAQYNLGVIYDIGLAGTKDFVEALLWFHAASDQGHARAHYALGLAYAEGKGAPRDNRLAMDWFRKAAMAGVADAQLALGVMFDEGIGTPADAKQAYYWLRRAEISGNERAATRLGRLADRLTSNQRAEINDQVSRDGTSGLARAASAPIRTTALSAPGGAVRQQGTPSRQAPDRKTVRAIQRLLADLGFDPGPADGDVGPRTRAAIEEYQYTLDLPVNGRASIGLLEHLRQIADLPPTTN